MNSIIFKKRYSFSLIAEVLFFAILALKLAPGQEATVVSGMIAIGTIYLGGQSFTDSKKPIKEGA